MKSSIRAVPSAAAIPISCRANVARDKALPLDQASKASSRRSRASKASPIVDRNRLRSPRQGLRVVELRREAPDHGLGVAVFQIGLGDGEVGQGLMGVDAKRARGEKARLVEPPALRGDDRSTGQRVFIVRIGGGGGVIVAQRAVLVAQAGEDQALLEQGGRRAGPGRQSGVESRERAVIPLHSREAESDRIQQEVVGRRDFQALGEGCRARPGSPPPSDFSKAATIEKRRMFVRAGDAIASDASRRRRAE